MSKTRSKKQLEKEVQVIRDALMKDRLKFDTLSDSSQVYTAEVMTKKLDVFLEGLSEKEKAIKIGKVGKTTVQGALSEMYRKTNMLKDDWHIEEKKLAEQNRIDKIYITEATSKLNSLSSAMSSDMKNSGNLYMGRSAIENKIDYVGNEMKRFENENKQKGVSDKAINEIQLKVQTQKSRLLTSADNQIRTYEIAKKPQVNIDADVKREKVAHHKKVRQSQQGMFAPKDSSGHSGSSEEKKDVKRDTSHMRASKK